MNGKVFFVGSITSVGCTFLDWSIHWLAGRTTFYNVERGLTALVDNPVRAFNAHLHDKNHPIGFDESIETINKLKENTDFGSFYPRVKTMANQIKLHNAETLISDANAMAQLKKESMADYRKIWHHCHSNQIPLIFVSLTDHSLYSTAGRRLFKSEFHPDVLYAHPDNYFDSVLEFYFKKDISSYSEYNTWNKRELMAINLRHTHEDWKEFELDLTIDHKFINAQQLWTFGEDVVLECLEYLDMPLATDRLPQWRAAYREWQQEQKRILKFVYDIDHIVESIIGNFDFDLRPYNLTLIQESIIQHLLIYKHNVTIKNWQLEHFPDNTRELHQLLEPNFHPVENLYK